jgi:hypothetical protein
VVGLLIERPLPPVKPNPKPVSVAPIPVTLEVLFSVIVSVLPVSETVALPLTGRPLPPVPEPLIVTGPKFAFAGMLIRSRADIANMSKDFIGVILSEVEFKRRHTFVAMPSAIIVAIWRSYSFCSWKSS